MLKTAGKYVLVLLLCGIAFFTIYRIATYNNSKTLEEVREDPKTNEEKQLWKHLVMRNWGRPLDENDKMLLERLQLKEQKEKFEKVLANKTNELTNEVIYGLKSFPQLKLFVEQDKDLYNIIYNELKPVVHKQIINSWALNDSRFVNLYQNTVDKILDIIFDKYDPKLKDYTPK